MNDMEFNTPPVSVEDTEECMDNFTQGSPYVIELQTNPKSLVNKFFKYEGRSDDDSYAVTEYFWIYNYIQYDYPGFPHYFEVKQLVGLSKLDKLFSFKQEIGGITTSQLTEILNNSQTAESSYEEFKKYLNNNDRIITC